MDALAERYRDLAVVACEWRAMGLADPQEMADEVFARLDRRKDHGLQDLYRSIDKVVMVSFQRHSDGVNLLDRLRGGVIIGSSKRSPADDLLRALSNLRGRDRELLQLRFWDELTEDESGEVLGLSIEQVRERLAKAGISYLKKLTRSHPDLAISDVVDTVKSIKPGIYRRGVTT